MKRTKFYRYFLLEKYPLMKKLNSLNVGCFYKNKSTFFVVGFYNAGFIVDFLESKGQQTSSEKGHTENILSFAAHTISITTLHCHPCSEKAAIETT